MSPADGHVYDLGYRRYEGPRREGASPVLALAGWSALRSLGLRQGWKRKVIPALLFALAMTPALIAIGIFAVVDDAFRERVAERGTLILYEDYYGLIDLVMLLGAAAVVPLLVCPDRRYRTLGLYFATAVGRDGYVIAKVLAAIMPMLAVTLLPMLTLYAGNVLLAASARDYLSDNADVIPRIVASGFLLAGFYSMLGLALASFFRQSAIATGALIGLVIATGALGHILVVGGGAPDWVGLVSLREMPQNAVDALFGADPSFGPGGRWWLLATLAVTLAAAAVFRSRYRGEVR